MSQSFQDRKVLQLTPRTLKEAGIRGLDESQDPPLVAMLVWAAIGGISSWAFFCVVLG